MKKFAFLNRTKLAGVVCATVLSVVPGAFVSAATQTPARSPANAVSGRDAHGSAVALGDIRITRLTQAPAVILVQSAQEESEKEGTETRENSQRDLDRELGIDTGKDNVLRWFLHGDEAYAIDPESNVLSRLWWQANPLEIVGASSGSYLGIGVADVTKQMAEKLNLSEVRGVVVTAVAEGSPAQKAGLKVKDVLVAYNGSRLEGRQQLTRMVGETPAERTITLSILRNGAPQEIRLTTAPRRMNPELKIARPQTLGRNMFILPDLPRMVSIYRSPMLGIESETLNVQLAAYFGVKDGVLVREVIPESPAAIAGVKAGDVVVEFAGEEVASPSDVGAILRAKGSKGEPLSLVVVRNQKRLQLTISPSGEWTEGRYFKDDPVENWSKKQE